MIVKNHWSGNKSFPKDLLVAKELVYDRFDFDCTQPQQESESIDYGAYRFYLNEKHVCYREAKITPTKTGQFVTLWKRVASGIIAPFDVSDPIDFVVINVQKGTFSGQFIFPKSILLEKGVFSTETKEGKRAIRVYPPWDETPNDQSIKSQKWQLKYYYSISPETDLRKFEKLII